MRITSLVLAAATAGFVSMAATAGPVFFEVEPNNSIATAQDLGFIFGEAAVIGSLVPDDVDYCEMDLVAGTLFSAVVDFTPGDPFDNDSLLGLFDSSGTLIASDDDSGPGFLSLLFVDITVSGTYYLAVTGFGDSDFNGSGHDEDFGYKLVINSIPAPATLAGLAGLLVARRRRRAI